MLSEEKTQKNAFCMAPFIRYFRRAEFISCMTWADHVNSLCLLSFKMELIPTSVVILRIKRYSINNSLNHKTLSILE
jgi:hypothetical protein